METEVAEKSLYSLKTPRDPHSKTKFQVKTPDTDLQVILFNYLKTNGQFTSQPKISFEAPRFRGLQFNPNPHHSPNNPVETPGQLSTKRSSLL